MPTILQIRRGLRSTIPVTDNHPGQIFFATDTQELFATTADLIVKKVRDVWVGAAEPVNRVYNQLWFDTVSHQLKVYDGSSWSPALDNRIGNLNNLLTHNKSCVVAAINEVYQMSLGDISFDEFLGQTVNVSFSCGAFSKRAVAAVLTRTAGNAIILTTPAGASGFRVYTFVPGVAPLPPNNNPFLESIVSKMLIPIDKLSSVELASTVMLSSFTAEPTSGTAPLQVTFNCVVNYPDIIYEYQWDFGDGSPVMTTQTGKCRHTYANFGIYMASCRVLDIYGSVITSNPLRISTIQACMAQNVITQVIDPWKKCRK